MSKLLWRPPGARGARGGQRQSGAGYRGCQDYVAKRGYFTPRVLPGATLVEAKGVTQLLQAGGTCIDNCTEVEFNAGHMHGARLVSHVEKNAKDVDFKAEDDQFDLSKLPPDRASGVVRA